MAPQKSRLLHMVVEPIIVLDPNALQSAMSTKQLHYMTAFVGAALTCSLYDGDSGRWSRNGGPCGGTGMSMSSLSSRNAVLSQG